MKWITSSIGDSALGKFLSAKFGCDLTQTPAPTTAGAINSHIQHKEQNKTHNQNNQTINKHIKVTVSNPLASAQDIAREIARSSYAFSD